MKYRDPAAATTTDISRSVYAGALSQPGARGNHAPPTEDALLQAGCGIKARSLCGEEVALEAASGDLAFKARSMSLPRTLSRLPF
jgi:hypothetical protein